MSLHAKRLERGPVHLADADAGVVPILAAQLGYGLDGID